MELRQLRYFVKVGELLNFTEAARELFVSQSTLSQQIRSLEDELRCSLLVRDSHSVTLTEEGRYFLSDARKTLQQAQQCVDRIADVQNLDEGELNIGCTHSFGTILRETMLDFTSRHPNIHLNARFKTMEELMGMLQRQEVDFALSYKPHELFDNVESHVLFDNKLCVFLSESHPLAAELSGCQISLTRMQALKYAMPTRGMQARNLFEMLIDDKGYAFDIRLEINEVNTITDIVRNSHFATVLSRAAVTAQSGLVCVPIDVSGNNIEGCFHILRGKYVKKSVKEFIRILSSKNADNIMLQHWFD
ncbi:MAG: LysR family transcriptional regulator [Bacteroidales bacterium]|nr:LysR family transcriptional regulator [Bacteroidales bacterium]